MCSSEYRLDVCMRSLARQQAVGSEGLSGNEGLVRRGTEG